jgi:hypothetical protein
MSVVLQLLQRLEGLDDRLLLRRPFLRVWPVIIPVKMSASSAFAAAASASQAAKFVAAASWRNCCSSSSRRC